MIRVRIDTTRGARAVVIAGTSRDRITTRIETCWDEARRLMDDAVPDQYD